MREKKKLNQWDLAKITGISRATIQNIEKKRNLGQIEKLYKILCFLENGEKEEENVISSDIILEKEKEDLVAIINKFPQIAKALYNLVNRRYHDLPISHERRRK